MNLYEVISKRKTIRKYKKDKVSDQILKQILAFGRTVSALDDQIVTKIEIADNTKGTVVLKGIGKVEAPYYLLLFSEDKKGYDFNAGCVMEQMVLYLSAKGLGSCYQGGVKIEMGQTDLKLVMVVAFGFPEGMLYREAALAKRLPLKELCVFKEEVEEPVKLILKAARLAPSSLNTQPWRFIVYKDKIHVFVCRELFHTPVFSALREINMGIMLAHMMLAAEEMWMELHFIQEEGFKKKAYKNGEYIGTAQFR